MFKCIVHSFCSGADISSTLLLDAAGIFQSHEFGEIAFADNAYHCPWHTTCMPYHAQSINQSINVF